MKSGECVETVKAIVLNSDDGDKPDSLITFSGEYEVLMAKVLQKHLSADKVVDKSREYRPCKSE